MQDEEIVFPKGYTLEEKMKYIERKLNEVFQRVAKLEHARRRVIPSVTACRCDSGYTGLPCRCSK